MSCFLIVQLLLVGMYLPAFGGSQLDGRFYLSKEKYSAGEPVFLIFEVDNSATQFLLIKTAAPLSFCGGYTIEVEAAKRQESFGWYDGVWGSCASSSEVLNPGGTHMDRILLNESYDLRQPGTYSLRVSHELPYGPGNGDLTMLNPGGLDETFSAQLEIILETSQDRELKPTFRKYLFGLQSDDAGRRIEAANVVANLAPRFLGGTILHMIDSPDLKYFAVRGLHNLGTLTGRQALVFAAAAEPGMYRS